MKARLRLTSAVLAVFLLIPLQTSVFACQDFSNYNTSLCIDYFANAYFRLTQAFGPINRTLFNANTGQFFTRHADQLMFQRNQLSVTLDSSPESLSELAGFPIRLHLRINPWYDSAYDVTGWGQGMYHNPLADQLSTNMNGRMAEMYDPLFREYYIDLHPKHFFIRIGRQIVAWGKSDGFYILDILNNFNLVNPEIFNEQDVKIPNWMINATWNATNTGSLQALIIPLYIPSYYAGYQIQGNKPVQGGYGDFTYNIISYFNNFYNGSFGFKVPVYVRNPTASRINNWQYGVRWDDTAGAIHYTLNYFYTYTTSMVQYANTGNFNTATSVNFYPHRMTVAGGSADYELNNGTWLDGTVLRGESAIYNGDQYYMGLVGNPVGVTHWPTMLAVDRDVLGNYFDRPVFASMQYYQDVVVKRNNSVAGSGPYSNMYQGFGFYGGHSGMRDPYYSASTLFLYKTWLAGDTLTTQFAAVHEWEFNDWWLQPQVSYRYDDKTTFVAGFNIFAGQAQTTYGQFTNATNAFFELHRVIF
jgi:hypothetical protein